METQKWQNLNALCQVEQREAIVRKHLKYTGRPREDKGDFYKVCLYKIHSALTPDEECFFSSLVQGGNLSYRSFMFLLYLVLGKKGEIGICFLHHFSSVAQLCLTLCDPMNAARQASLSITNSRSLPKLMSIESVMPSKHLILCCPLLLLPSIFPSIRVFSNESLRIR